MDFQKMLAELSPLKFLKIAGVIVLALVVLGISIQLIGTSLKSLSGKMGISITPSYVGGKGGGLVYNEAGYDSGYAESDYAVSSTEGVAYRDSIGIYPPPYPQSPTGDDA